MKTALLSVSDKSGIVDFANGLIQQGFRIISTGGTKKKYWRPLILRLAVLNQLPIFLKC